MWRGTISWLRPATAALVLLTCPLAGAAVETQPEELLLAVRRTGHPPGAIIPVLVRGEQALIPLGALADSLGLAVRVDPDRGRASGFVIDPGRSFELEIERGFARSGSVEVKLTRENVLALADDIYLELGLLVRLLPVDLGVDRLSAVLEVHPRETLPVDLRDARGRRGNLTSEDPRGPQGLPVDHPRELWRTPVIDLAATVQSREDSGTTANASTLLSGDLLYLDATLFLSGSDSQWNEPRWSLGRRDPHGRALGPIGATEAVIGDVTFPRVPLIAGTSSGRGLFATNRPLDRSTSFDRHTFRGSLPPGWDLELYRDDELIAWVADPNTGLYEIPDVELRWGPNRFRLVFYGPRGERREEVVTFDVGDGQVSPGATEWRLAYLDKPVGLGTSRGIFELEHGLGRRVSLGASVSTVEIAGEDQQYAGLNLRGAFGRVLIGVEGSRSLDNDTGALRLTARTYFGRVRVGLEHEVFEDGFLVDPQLERFGPVRSRSLVRADGGIRIGARQGLSIGSTLLREELFAGGTVLEASARLGWSAPGLFVTNQFSWTQIEDVDRPQETGRGTLLVSRHARFGTLRAEVGYELVPDSQLDAAALTFERRLGRELLLSVEASRNLGPSGHYEVLGELRRLRGSFGYGLGLGWSELTGALAQASLSLGLARDPLGQRWFTDALPLATAGAVSLRAFLDLDGSGAWSAGDEPLEGVGFLVDRTVPRVRSDSAGVAFIGRLTAWRAVRVAIATHTLEDPLYRPASDGVEIIPRPGVVASIDLPVQMTGELTGTLHVREGNNSSERGGVRVELRDLAGDEVFAARSAYDGFYEITQIPPGQYILVVPFDELARLDANGVAAHRIDVGTTGGIFDGRDLVVVRAPLADGGEVTVATLHEPQPPIDEHPAEPAATASATTRSPAAWPPSSAPVIVSSGGWVVQIGSSRTRRAADELMATAVAKLGATATVVTADLGERGIWYRVRLFAGTDRQQAEQFRATVEQQLGISGSLLIGVDHTPQPTAQPAIVRTPAGQWALQLASRTTANAAREEATAWETRLGPPVVVVPVEVEGLGTRYRVYAAGFGTASDAQEQRERLAASGVAAVGPINLVQQ